MTPAQRESFRERRRRRRSGRRERRRAVYLLPNLITSTGLMLGFWSITLSIRGEFDKAALAIVLAMICDMLDGRVARATHSSSRFGVEFDSLSDLTAFGLAPALLMYNWTLLPLGPRGWLIAGLFALCAALRLARFNARADGPSAPKHFQGIASTFAGGMVAATVWFVSSFDLEPPFPRPLGIAITSFFALLALLMVSTIPYPSLKAVKIDFRRAYSALVGIAVLMVVVLLNHEKMLFAIGCAYLVSGPVLWWMERHKPKLEDAAERERESLSDVH
ncbi:MAG TPA: CDP-diacylglycerol--serine O-phosphatidyltransferase [Myxococcota bacterium]|nr:CDP-diacylglycerol--serine O-phosphatidyltransferase [Myxococcota bacterium]